MSVYNQITLYGPKDSLASGDPNKVIHGTQIDAEFTAIHNATLDCASLSLSNTFSGGNTFNSSIVLNGSPTGTLGSGAVFNSATGGAQGAGTINATGLFVNGSPVSVNLLPSNNTWTGSNVFQGSPLVDRPSTSAGYGILELDDQTGARKFQAVFIGSTAGGVYGSTAGNVVLDTPTGVSMTLSTGDTARLIVSSAGNFTFGAPSSGLGVSISGASGSYATLVTAGGSAGTQKGFSVVTTTQNAADRLINANNSVSNLLDIFGDGHGTLGPTLTWNSAGAMVINAPTSGESLTIGAAAGADCLNLLGNSGTSNSFGLAVQAGTNSSDYAISARNRAATQTYFLVRGDGDVQAIDQAGNLQDVGWRDMPQTLQNSSYSFALSDRGKHVYTSTNGVTYTIPANGSVAFPIGSTIVVVNDSGGNIFVQITTDTLAWFQGGATSTGNRTIAAGSIVTLVKVSATRWSITGLGIS